MVGATGFEPATPCAQGRCATRLRYAPTAIALRLYVSFADAPRDPQSGEIREPHKRRPSQMPPPDERPDLRPTGYWKYGFTPCGSGVLSSATIIDEI